MTPARVPAIANLAALTPAYKSKTEGYWADIGHVYIADEFDARVVHSHYEPFNINLGGHYWKPDFLHILETGQQIIVEVKGTKRHKGFATSLIKIKDAARMFPYWTFVLAVGGAKGFELETINP